MPVVINVLVLLLFVIYLFSVIGLQITCVAAACCGCADGQHRFWCSGLVHNTVDAVLLSFLSGLQAMILWALVSIPDPLSVGIAYSLRMRIGSRTNRCPAKNWACLFPSKSIRPSWSDAFREATAEAQLRNRRCGSLHGCDRDLASITLSVS
jgi:hypothetical protein